MSVPQWTVVVDYIDEVQALTAALQNDPQAMRDSLDALLPEQLEWLATASRELHKMSFRMAYEKREAKA